MQQITLSQLMDAEPPTFTPDMVKVCQDRDCGISFITSDPDRKWCDACLCERINGAGILEDDEDDQTISLFDEPPPIRPERRARVQCRVCGHEARIPILADAKICDTCLADLPAHQARIDADMERATNASFNADLDLHTAIGDASERDRTRYDHAVLLREANDSRIKDAWSKALRAGDGLARLLAADDAQRAAEQALTTALSHGQVALEEIAKVTT